MKGIPVNSLRTAIDEAREFGREYATLDHGPGSDGSVPPVDSAHNTGRDPSALFLAGYRSDKANGLTAVVKAYQEGYNTRSADLGAAGVEWEQLKAGILHGMEGLKGNERAEILEAM